MAKSLNHGSPCSPLDPFHHRAMNGTLKHDGGGDPCLHLKSSLVEGFCSKEPKDNYWDACNNVVVVKNGGWNSDKASYPKLQLLEDKAVDLPTCLRQCVPKDSFQSPIMLQSTNKNPVELKRILFEGYSIASFLIGGEPRLCVPDLLNQALKDFRLDEINPVFNRLCIYNVTCSTQQLQLLKDGGILPKYAGSSGLITKTDAHRLVHAILYEHVVHVSSTGSTSFRVNHSCFGKCSGVVHLELYTEMSAPCIQCSKCEGFFAPERFVCHCHAEVDTHLCYWGFDPENWRIYLKLSKDQQDEQEAKDYFEKFKNKFDPASSGSYKRKQVLKSKETKKVRPSSHELLMQNVIGCKSCSFSAFYHAGFSKESAPYFVPSKEPPVLECSERVVPSSESQKLERHSQPNVALAPLKLRHKKIGHTSVGIAPPTPTKTLVASDSLYGAFPQNRIPDPASNAFLLKSEPVQCERPSSNIRNVPQNQERRAPSDPPYPHPDLELSTTDSDTDSVSSNSSSCERLEEIRALLRGWPDRAAADKTFELIRETLKKEKKKAERLEKRSADLERDNKRLSQNLRLSRQGRTQQKEPQCQEVSVKKEPLDTSSLLAAGD